ncbi:MAG: hypothetical protein L3J46_07200, partial [Kangiellaceae bacterium]|nr:hypothetical protein [Kangiellaceae bacterium]
AVHQLGKNAAKQGILIEAVDDYYFDLSGDAASQMEVCFRMGVTSLEEPKIREGVAKLAKLIRELSGEQFASLDESPTKPLNQQQLLQKLVGSTLICKTVYGAPCTIELRANGKMIGHAGHANEDYDTGRWWVDGDMWYRQWKEWAYAEQAGFFVTLGQSDLEGEVEKSSPPQGVSHQTISWYNQGGRLVDTAIIQFASSSRPKLV